MNSPSNFRNPGYPQNHQSRYVPKFNQPPNVYVPKSPMMVIHQSLASPVNHNASFSTIQKSQTFTEINQNNPKLFDSSHKNSSKNTSNRSIETKFFNTDQKTSDISQCSIKETTQSNINEEINNRLNMLTEKMSTALLRIAGHDEKIREIQQKAKQKQIQPNYTNQKMQNAIWQAVEKQIAQTHNHLTLQQRLIKADIDTLKLQILCYANKKQLRESLEKVEANDKSVKNVLKEYQNNLKQEINKIGERRKKDIEIFQKEIEDIKIKMMNIIFQEEKRQAIDKGKICLIRCLSFKVMHQMRVYNEDELKWIQMGTGETVYGLDQQGFILDNESKYITDPNGSPIQLEPAQIELLKKYGLTR